MPANSSNRKQLNKVIDNVNEGKGEMIYDVELVLLADDENDQGYLLSHSHCHSVTLLLLHSATTMMLLYRKTKLGSWY